MTVRPSERSFACTASIISSLLWHSSPTAPAPLDPLLTTNHSHSTRIYSARPSPPQLDPSITSPVPSTRLPSVPPSPLPPLRTSVTRLRTPEYALHTNNRCPTLLEFRRVIQHSPSPRFHCATSSRLSCGAEVGLRRRVAVTEKPGRRHTASQSAFRRSSAHPRREFSVGGEGGLNAARVTPQTVESAL